MIRIFSPYLMSSHSHKFIQHHVPRALVRAQYSLFQAYLSKLEKSHKHGNIGLRVIPSVCETDTSTRKKSLKDRVIK